MMGVPLYAAPRPSGTGGSPQTDPPGSAGSLKCTTRWRRGIGPRPSTDLPNLCGQADDDPPLKPCKWSHGDRGELADRLGSRFGNWCAPPDEWTNPIP